MTVPVVVVLALLALVVVGLVGWRAVRRRREGWYADGGQPPTSDTRGAIARHSWMLGGGGSGGG